MIIQLAAGVSACPLNGANEHLDILWFAWISLRHPSHCLFLLAAEDEHNTLGDSELRGQNPVEGTFAFVEMPH